MLKPKLLFKAPVTTRSGYGVHSRQLLKALLASGAFDISVRAISWGQTPFIIGDDPFVESLKQLIFKAEAEALQHVSYDISVQVTIPNEFEKLARVNVGITAGIETDRVSPTWLQKVNEMVDLLIVPSVHSAQAFAGPRYHDGRGSTINLQRTMMIAAEGVDTSVFNLNAPDTASLEKFKFETSFNFLSVGLGFDKGMGEDRKNFTTLVKWFLESFHGNPNVGLVLKVGMVGNSLIDFEMVKNRIADLRRMTGLPGEFPRIYLIHGRLSDQEMAALYKHPQIKSYVSLTHGEGFGLPLLEAAACGLPIMATNWSGHLDFLKINGKRRFIPFEFDLAPIPKAAVWQNVMDEGSQWANVREADVKNKLKKIITSYERPKEWAMELAGFVAANFSLENVSYGFVAKLVEFFNSQVKPVQSIFEAADQIKKDLAEPADSKTLLYTMPMSAGDVYISTGVIDSLKKKFPDHKIFFATEQKYADILKGNPNIHKLMVYQPWMTNVPLCELVFDEVYTPNLAIQTTTANWIRGGKGRLLGEEMAVQCQVDFGEYFIECDPVDIKFLKDYVVLHPGSGKGQWEARNYLHWQEVVNNVKKLTDLLVVQVGAADDPLYEGVEDLRGKTTYNQLATIIQNSKCLVGIDTVSTHLAAGLGIPHVAIFGSSYSTSTGPTIKSKRLSVLLDTPSRYTCEKACYKYECSVDKNHPCINEISARSIVRSVWALLEISEAIPTKFTKEYEDAYEEYHPKLVGYTTILNGVSNEYPFLRSIQSMLGFCDSVVVVDGGSTDGTREALDKLSVQTEGKLTVINHEWDWNVPGMDGMQKAFARAVCPAGPNDFLWQQDADEVVSPDDYEKIKKLVDRFPSSTDLLHLPVVELWGKSGKVRTDRHSWKWRLSRNNFRITHGIVKQARVTDEKTGKVYAKKGQSDGCEYVDVMTQEYIPHQGFYTSQLDVLRQQDPVAYGVEMNKIFGQIPSVYHYSWYDLPRKIRNFKQFWNRCWSNIYNDPSPEDRFPGVETEEQIQTKAAELEARGGEHGEAKTFQLERKHPLAD